MRKHDAKVLFGAFGFLVFVIFTMWGFDYGLRMMNEPSDIKMVLGIALSLFMVALWVLLVIKVVKEGKEYYEAYKKVHAVGEAKVNAVGPSGGPPGVSADVHGTDPDKKG
jgi:hypothetical protein